MKIYKVRVACHVAGHWRTPDVPFALTDAQARLLAPPHGSVVIPVENNNDRQHGHKRKDRRASK